MPRLCRSIANSHNGGMVLTQAVPRPAKVLDPAQLVRIEAVHRGFLFQHLKAARCLSALPIWMQEFLACRSVLSMPMRCRNE